MNIDLLTLKLFIAVCEETAIVKAAEREGIAASALSKRMSDLEASVKLTLFHRHRKGLEPTDAARALLYHARTVLRDLAQLETEIGEHQRGLKGTIRIQANVWAILQYLPDDLASFLAQHRMVRVEVEESISSATVQAVATQAADIGIIGSNVPATGLEVLPYRQDTLVAVLPVNHPLCSQTSLRFADLLDYQLIGAKQGSALDGLMQQAIAELERPPTLRIRVSGFETVCRMVEANLGIGLVPSDCAARYLAAMRMASVPLDEPWATRRLNLCLLPEPARSALTRRVAQHLAAGPPAIVNHDVSL
jgi:DNA-binding transcriptional LysR family regulator